MKLYEKVRAYRLAHGIKQTFVADETGISVKTINGIEMGRQRLSADMFELICTKGLKVNPGIFFAANVLITKNSDETDQPNPAA